MVHLLALIATVSFGGVVPPHRASDGRVFMATASTAQAVEAGLKACAVTHFAPLGAVDHGLAGGQAYQFALAPADGARDDCVAARLGEGGRVERRERWIG